MRAWWLLGVCLPALGQLPTCSAVLWDPCELEFRLQESEGSGEPTMRAEFRSPHRDTRTFRAFRDGSTFVIRFTPDEAGEWDYRITSSVKRYDGQTGKVTGTAPSAGPLAAPRGFVRPATTIYFQTTTAIHHFQTTGVQPHLWMGTEVPDFLRLSREDFEALIGNRAAEKFNHIRVVIPTGADLKAVTERVRIVHDHGLTTDIVLQEIPAGRREREKYITEMVARLAPFNITWMGVPAYERVPNAAAVLRDAGELLRDLDPYKHPRTMLAEFSSMSLSGDRNGGWMDMLAYGTADPNVGAVEHQLARIPAINTDVKSRADLWNLTMNGQYPASGGGSDFTAWYDIMSRMRYWEMEPYFDVTGGRAIAVRDFELRAEDVIDAAEYLVYVEKPGPVTINVQQQKYDVEWINPATGERVKGKDFKGKSYAGEPPDKSHDWLLHVFREGYLESLLKSYKFDSRPTRLQTPETAMVPFEIDAPAVADIPFHVPGFYGVKVTRATRATQNLLVVWTAELTTGNQAGIVVGTGMQGPLKLPEAFGQKLPAVVTLRASILNANGKVYVIDRAFRLVP